VARARRPEWARMPDRELLAMRMCDLALTIERTPVAPRIERLCAELASRGMRFRPHFWLSDEWFSPNGVPGIAVPFYLAHPRLMRLEERQMLEVEGGSYDWCMRILRHEAGHAIDTAYRLHRRQRWRELFGRSSEPYPDAYHPRPYSKNFVLHLDMWYAQSNPSEDFAESFAVWLKPGSDWRRRYREWPAIKKLAYVDELMAEVARVGPALRSRRRVEPLATIRKTLREHYEQKRSRYGAGLPEFYDRDLQKLFDGHGRRAGGVSAAVFLRRMRPEFRRLISEWTGDHPYSIDQVLREMISRCRELRLRLTRPERAVRQDALIFLTAQTMIYLHGSRHRVML
jgi:hypothetical protein